MTNIEWTDVTWNPVIGCRHVAEGCRHCYAETMSKRLAAMGQTDYASILDAKGKFNGRAITRPEKLAEPLRWKKPRRVFVNSMSDLFHEDMPFEFIAAVFGVMAACPQHMFQVLTKRPERAREFFAWITAKAEGDDSVANTPREFAVMQAWYHDGPENGLYLHGFNSTSKHRHGDWPLKNVWLGVSVATQADADKNIPELLQCPAAVRFVSAEPLIGEVKFRTGNNWTAIMLGCGDVRGPTLNWVIVGGESGPGARQFKWEWAQSLRDQCEAASVPMFFKQVGSNATLWNEFEKRDGPIFTNDRKGGDPAGWPEPMPREFPKVEAAHA